MTRCLQALFCAAVIALTFAGDAGARGYVTPIGWESEGHVARFSPGPVAIHPVTNELYFVDHMRWIRKLDSLQRVETVAVSGCAGSSPDPFDKALRIGALAFHPRTHELYFTDTPNRICKLTANGEVVTVLANFRMRFRLFSRRRVVTVSPYALAFDQRGDLFFSDGVRIFKIDLQAGEVEVVAGTGKPEFNGDGLSEDTNVAPIALVYHPELHELFFSEESRIRRFSIGMGSVKTVAGTGGRSFNGDGYAQLRNLNPFSLAVDPFSNEIYFSDGSTRIRSLRKHQLSGGLVNMITSIAGPTMVQLVGYDHWSKVQGRPYWLAISPRTGKLFFSDGGTSIKEFRDHLTLLSDE